MPKKSASIPVLAGGAALLLMANSKKKPSKRSKVGKVRWGVRVSPDCQSAEIVDSVEFNAFIFGGSRELSEIDPTLTLIQISDALFGEVAPGCRGFPEDPNSSDIADLYMTIVQAVGPYLVDGDHAATSLDELADEVVDVNLIDWYNRWRNYPTSTVPEAPPSEVAFSGDLTRYIIGKDWYSKTLVPFVANALKEGISDIADLFLENRGVLVGKDVIPASELPEDKGAVSKFFDYVEESVARAELELSK